jgi:hypothetical protein
LVKLLVALARVDTRLVRAIGRTVLCPPLKVPVENSNATVEPKATAAKKRF